MLDFLRLRVLDAVARHGSVTAAARELHYSQPSVSHHLARLEAETGARLVQRTGRGIRLTEAGRLLADRAAEILGRVEAAAGELAAHTGLRAGRVRLAAFPSALGSFVPAAAARLARDHPGVEVRLVDAEPPEALAMLRAGQVDVAVTFRHTVLPATDEGVRLTPLLADPGHLVVPAPGTPAQGSSTGRRTGNARHVGAAPEAPAVQKTRTAAPITQKSQTAGGTPGTRAGDGAYDGPPGGLAAYRESRWIVGCERCRAQAFALCAEAGFTPSVAFITDDYVAVQAMVAAGLGVALLPELALTAHRRPDVATYRIPGATRAIFAATYGEPPDPPATTALLAALTTATTR
ncbi:hypothetical protein Sru01_02820 [Sphaerisporangium rufum]|uniref:HTH lysR-type domain-containing protein n=1 Tax=Sphaerisporangium rufum TaxID=1381558 RepID=A0A919V2H5_9ACTN|nr:LysR family transcriptional regulator [Sphaerisporangium rufum]GII75300.1 hypothetical protein Sru01_02820 [Sphaerisporangium rufum]